MLELNADCRGSTHNPHPDEEDEEEEEGEGLIRVYMLFRPPQSTSGCSMYPAQLPYHLQIDSHIARNVGGKSWITCIMLKETLILLEQGSRQHKNPGSV